MRILVLAGRSPGMILFCSLMRDAGFEVAHVATLAEARVRARVMQPEIVVAGLFPGADRDAGESALGLILTMQAHTPGLITILLTDSPLFAHGELFGMLGSLRCVLAEAIPAGDLAEVIRHLLGRERGPRPVSVGMPVACGHCLVADQCRDAAAARAAYRPHGAIDGDADTRDLSAAPRCIGCGFGG